MWAPIRSGLAGIAAALLMTAPLGPSLGEGAGSVVQPWQEVIDSQIRAFREKDAAAAFGYAGVVFQITFPTAEAFYEVILQSGYAQIADSHSHSFGPFRMVDGGSVVQQVRFIGTDQQIYGTHYQLREEADGWRVQGVQGIWLIGVAI